MKVSIMAVRDADKVVLGKIVADITDRKAMQLAVSNLLDQVYAAAPALELPPFTFKFDKA
jgi:hypothetical protein